MLTVRGRTCTMRENVLEYVTVLDLIRLADDRWLVARMYDADCLRYARKHLRGWPLVALVVGCRRLAEYGIRIGRRGVGSPR